jgi:UDP-galactose transporter
MQMLMTDYNQIKSKGFFFGYSFLVWTVIMLSAQGGLLCAVVVKYADNILKGFATSLAIILSCIISIYAFDFNLTLQFAFGTFVVIGSVFLYGKPVSLK